MTKQWQKWLTRGSGLLLLVALGVFAWQQFISLVLIGATLFALSLARFRKTWRRWHEPITTSAFVLLSESQLHPRISHSRVDDPGKQRQFRRHERIGQVMTGICFLPRNRDNGKSI